MTGMLYVISKRGTQYLILRYNLRGSSPVPQHSMACWEVPASQIIAASRCYSCQACCSCFQSQQTNLLSYHALEGVYCRRLCHPHIWGSSVWGGVWTRGDQLTSRRQIRVMWGLISSSGCGCCISMRMNKWPMSSNHCFSSVSMLLNSYHENLMVVRNYVEIWFLLFQVKWMVIFTSITPSLAQLRSWDFLLVYAWAKWSGRYCSLLHRW